MSFIIKGKFEEGSKYSGMMLLSIAKDSTISKFSFVIKSGNQFTTVDITDSWKKFDEIITSEAAKIQEYDQLFPIYRKAMDHFTLRLTSEKVEKINKLISTSRDDYLKNVLIKDILQEELSQLLDMKLTLKIAVDEIDDGQDEEEEEDNPPDENTKEKSSYFVYLSCSPVVSPAKGIKANKIKLGDEVFLKITDTKEDLPKVIPAIYEQARSEGKVVSEMVIKAPVVEVERDITNEAGDLSTKIIVQFASGVFGTLFCQSEFKLKGIARSDASADITDMGDDSKDSVENLSMFFILGGVILFLIAIIFIIVVYA